MCKHIPCLPSPVSVDSLVLLASPLFLPHCFWASVLPLSVVGCAGGDDKGRGFFSQRWSGLASGQWLMPEPRAEPLRAKITVLGTHVITSADPAWGEGKAWQSVGAVLGTAMINWVNSERSCSHPRLARRALPQPRAPSSTPGHGGQSAELNPLMQELNSAFLALIHSFIPCIFQSAGVMKSCPGLSPICLWGEGEHSALPALLCSKGCWKEYFLPNYAEKWCNNCTNFSLLKWQLLTS